jgi:uncharacterized membrane protein YdbT with pleckstrin-like domain
MSNNTLVWKDRKRFMGMPITFTRYGLSEDRLFLSVGLFSVRDEEVLLYRVRDISTRRSLWQRIFGMGSVTVLSSDKTMPTLVLKNVSNPLTVKELIHDHVEAAKLKNRVRVSEVSADLDVDDDLDCEL